MRSSVSEKLDGPQPVSMMAYSLKNTPRQKPKLIWAIPPTRLSCDGRSACSRVVVVVDVVTRVPPTSLFSTNLLFQVEAGRRGDRRRPLGIADTNNWWDVQLLVIGEVVFDAKLKAVTTW